MREMKQDEEKQSIYMYIVTCIKSCASLAFLFILSVYSAAISLTLREADKGEDVSFIDRGVGIL